MGSDRKEESWRRCEEEKHTRRAEADAQRHSADQPQEGTGEGDLRLRWIEHERAWEDFEASTAAGIKAKHVPWPPVVRDLLKWMANGGARDGDCHSQQYLKRVYRQAALRWHPDRFMSKFGARLLDSDKETILQRVKEISQDLNQSWDSISAA